MAVDTYKEDSVMADSGKWLGLENMQYPPESIALINQAMAFAEEYYAKIDHPVGKPYIQYALEVTSKLLELHPDPFVLAAALIYPPPPVETSVLPVLKKTFKNQKELLALVDDIHHLGQIEWSGWAFSPEQHELRRHKEILQKMYHLAIDDLVVDSETLQSEKSLHFQKKEKQIENLIRMFFASANNIHALIIKLIDRLHFIKLLKDVPDTQPVFANKLLLAKITLAIYAPIADRLGIWRLKSELEDMSFRLIQPDTFKKIAKQQLTGKKSEREQYVAEIIRVVREQLEDFGVQAEISGRAKHIYSIFQKMEAKQLEFDQINDLLGIRIIIDKDEDKDEEERNNRDKGKKEEERNNIERCYDVQEILHELWKPVTEPYQGEKGRDWIARPKENQYQSLHTTVIINGHMVEVQIRTREMHEIAEYGAAATHWRYKDSKAYKRNRITKVNKSKDLLWNQELANLRQRFGHDLITGKPTKDGPLKKRIYVLTPEGHVIDIAEGATPLDFAYRIHTKLGDTYTGAKVNGRYVSMDYELKNGDIIEVSTSRTRKGPNPDWLSKNRLDDADKDNDGTSSKLHFSEGIYRSGKEKNDVESELMYYVFARTRQARHKIRHALKPPKPQT